MFFIQQWVSIEASLGAVSSLQTFIKETAQEPDKQITGLDSELAAQSSALRLHFGPVQFEHVTATYKSYTSSHVALRDASLEIPGGTTAGVVGRTGSGKSSLFLALLNPAEYEGIIKINGQDISQVSRQVLRSFITSIPKDCLRLPGTIRQNLMLWPLIEDDSEGRDVDESIVHDTLVSLGLSSQLHVAGGLDTNMAELDLSAGEEQLFSLARSSLTRLHTGSRIVLMDEPTCNMDVEVDKRVQKLLKTIFAGCRVLHISHREQAVADSDAIFEIENGVIKLKESEQPVGE